MPRISIWKKSTLSRRGVRGGSETSSLDLTCVPPVTIKNLPDTSRDGWLRGGFMMRKGGDPSWFIICTFHAALPIPSNRRGYRLLRYDAPSARQQHQRMKGCTKSVRFSSRVIWRFCRLISGCSTLLPLVPIAGVDQLPRHNLLAVTSTTDAGQTSPRYRTARRSCCTSDWS